MSKLNRRKLQKMILQEFKMLGMGDPGAMGVMGLPSGAMHDDTSSCDDDAMMPSMEPMHDMPSVSMGMSGKGAVSREDCCTAVMCLIECCSCPVTKQALMECCEDIMAGDYDH